MSAPDVICLCYHAVSAAWPASLAVTPERLQRQLTSLVRRGWTGTTFTEAVLDPPASHTLAVTFDDAFLSVIDQALPILSALELPATVFAPTGFMHARQPLRWPGIDHWADSKHADELISMDWDDLRGLARAGWEIGSHTRTHPDLTRIAADEVSEQLGRSREECEAHLDRGCTALAYPYGSATGEVVRSAQAAGYAVAATLGASPRGVSDPRWYPRIGVWNADSDIRFEVKLFARQLQGSRLWQAGASTWRKRR